MYITAIFAHEEPRDLDTMSIEISILELQSKVSILENTLNKLCSTVKALEDENKVLSNQLMSNSNDRSSMSGTVTSNLGFFNAYRNSSLHAPDFTPVVINFDGYFAIENMSGFDLASGVFTAEVAGYYLITYSLQT